MLLPILRKGNSNPCIRKDCIVEYRFVLNEAEYCISLIDYRTFCIVCEKLCAQIPGLTLKANCQTYFLVSRKNGDAVAVFSVFSTPQDEKKCSDYAHVITAFEVDRNEKAETFGIDLMEEVLAFLATSYTRNLYGPNEVYVATNNHYIRYNLETTNLLNYIFRIGIGLLVRHKPENRLYQALFCFRCVFEANSICLFDNDVAVKAPAYKLFSLYGNKRCQIPAIGIG